MAMKAFDVARLAGRSVVWVGASTLEALSLRALAVPGHRTTTSGRSPAMRPPPTTSFWPRTTTRARWSWPGGPRGRAQGFITVLMRDVRLAEDAAAMVNEPRTRVLSEATVSARALNIDHPPFLIAKALGHARIHALIIGFGQTGQAIARDLIVNCRTTYLERPRITVVDPSAKALEGVMRVRAPELDACAEFAFIDGMIGTHGVEPDSAELGRLIAEAGPVTAAYVCRHVDSEALSAAGMLQSLLRAADVAEPPIFVRLRDIHTLSKTAEGARGLNSLIPFGDLEAIIAACEFLSNTPTAPPGRFPPPTAPPCRRRGGTIRTTARPARGTISTRPSARRPATASPTSRPRWQAPASTRRFGAAWPVRRACRARCACSPTTRPASGWPNWSMSVERPAADGRLALGRSSVQGRTSAAAPGSCSLREAARRDQGIRPRLRAGGAADLLGRGPELARGHFLGREGV